MFRNFANNENDYSEEILNLSLVFELIFKIENVRVRFLVDLKEWETANKLHIFERLLTCWKFNKINLLFIPNKDIFSIVYLQLYIINASI